MDPLKRFAEWYLGIEPAGIDENTAWSFRTSGPIAALPGWTLLLLAILFAGGVIWFYQRDGRAIAGSRRLVLASLRILSIGLMLLLLLQISLSVDRVGLPVVVVMIDDSASMQFQDEYKDLPRSHLTRTVPIGRLELAKSILTRNRAEFLRRLSSEYRIRLFRFSDRARPLMESGYSDPQVAIDAINAMRAEGQSTAPASSIRQVLDEFRGRSPAAIVVLSDGIASSSDSERPHAVTTSGRVSVPIYAIGLGSHMPSQDVEIRDVRADEVAIINQTLLFSATVRSRGFEGKDAIVELRDTTDNARLASKIVRINTDEIPVDLEYVPPKSGEFDYRVAVVPLAGEVITTNNDETRHVSVRNDRIAVLLIDRLPRYEYRFLKHLLERSDGRAGTIALHTVLTDADTDWAATDESAAPLAGRVPGSRDQLFEYDVIVLGDVPPSIFSPATLRDLRDSVREKGTGLVLIAGTKHNPREYRGTTIESLLPFDLSKSGTLTLRRDDEGIAARPTLAGNRGTQLFRFFDSPTDTARVIDNLPDLYSSAAVDDTTAGATVFLSDQTTDAPIVVGHQYGRGRVVFHATDDLWMWQQSEGNVHDHYWTTLIRSLSRSALLGRDATAELLTDRDVYRRGDDVQLTLRFLDARQQPNDGRVTLRVQRTGQASQVVAMEQSPLMPGTWTAVLTTPEDGRWTARVSEPVFAESAPQTSFEVQSSPEETRKRQMDRTSLQAVAKTTRGHFYTPSDVDELPDSLPPGTAVARRVGKPIRLWSRPELLVLLVLLLGTEWFLRKKFNLT